MNKKRCFFILYPVGGQKLVALHDRRRGGDDVAVVANQQKVAVGHLGRSSIGAHEDIGPVVVLPELPDLHFVQVGGLAQRP